MNDKNNSKNDLNPKQTDETVKHETNARMDSLEETQNLPTDQNEAGESMAKDRPIPQTGHGETVDFDRTQGFDISQRPTQRFEVPGYALMSELGRGGMGVVYKARQERADRIVALKAMINVDHARPEDIERFTIEAKASARLHHPNIIQVYEVGQSGSAPYFTQEFASGGTLASKIAKQMLSAEETAKLMLSISNAVAYAHAKGIVHRDLKPLNILLDENGNPKIADFGLARRMEDQSHLTQDGTILGTPSYMAPEQASGSSKAIGPRSDVYALGAILYELLTGRPPFKGANVWEVVHQVRNAEPVPPSQLQTGVPMDLETICIKCLQKSPDKRYDSAQHLADDLQRHIRNEPILARPIGQFERIVRLCKRNPREARLVGLVAGLLIMFSIGAAWTAFRINQDREKIAEQNKDIEHQRDEIAKEKQISDERLVLYRDTVSKTVNRVPRILESAPLGDGTRRELSDVIQGILDSSTDSGEIGSAKKWGQMAVRLREGDFLTEVALNSQNDQSTKEKLLREAGQLYDEVIHIAKEVYESDEIDRGKAASNYAIAMLRQAQSTYRQLPKARWPQEVVPLFKRSIELCRESIKFAAEQQSTELAKYESGLGNTLNIYVDFLMNLRPDSEQYRGTSLSYLAESEKTLNKVIASEGVPEELIDDSRARLVYCKEQQASILRLQKKHEEVIQAFEQRVELARLLLKSKPHRYRYLINLSRACNDYGDYLLTNKGPSDQIESLYTESLQCLQTIGLSPSQMYLEQDGLAMQHYRLGIIARRENRKNDAIKHFQHSLNIRRKGLSDQLLLNAGAEKESEAVTQRRLETLFCLGRTGEKNMFLEQINHVLKLAESLDSKTQSWQTQDIYKNSSAALGMLAQNLQEQSDAEYKPFLERAMQVMTRAIETGFSDVDYLQTDPDFDWLREMGQFEVVKQAIEKAVAAKAAASNTKKTE